MVQPDKAVKTAKRRTALSSKERASRSIITPSD